VSTPEQRSEGMSRRQLLGHTAWFGAAVVLTVTGGEVISHLGGTPAPAAVAADPRALRFVQVSDSHLGFHGPANTDVTGSFARAIDQINGLGLRPDFVIHTGDLTHLSTPDQFDQVRQMLGGRLTGHLFTVPV
jgi:Icc protein